MVYHSRDYLGLQGDPLSDPNRHTYLRTVKWKDGMPDFGQERPNDINVK
jgi:GH43 family beta-xylosidase